MRFKFHVFPAFSRAHREIPLHADLPFQKLPEQGAEVEIQHIHDIGKLPAPHSLGNVVAAPPEIVAEAGRLIDAFDQYDVAVTEIHHRGKADHPSGTALMIASKLLETIDRKKRIEIGCPEGRIAEDALEVSSLRVGSVPGTHTAVFDSAVDTIEITHTARSRAGFASGAIKAAEWLSGKDNGVYTMDDYMADTLGGR